MEKMRLFASVLIVGTLIVFFGCKKDAELNQESLTAEVQPAKHAEPVEEQQQTTVSAVESTSPTEHEVVAIVREFLKAIKGGDYDRAIELSTPGEFKREGLIQVNEAFDFSNIGISKALVGSQNAAVLINSISGPSGMGQFGCSLVQSNNLWLIRDVDWLPRNEAVEKWLAGFKGIEPNAQRIVGKE